MKFAILFFVAVFCYFGETRNLPHMGVGSSSSVDAAIEKQNNLIRELQRLQRNAAVLQVQYDLLEQFYNQRTQLEEAWRQEMRKHEDLLLKMNTLNSNFSDLKQRLEKAIIEKHSQQKK